MTDMTDGSRSGTALTLAAAPLTRTAFADFGDVIETEGRPSRLINQGSVEKFGELAAIDVLEKGGRPSLSIFRAQPQHLPMRLRLMERHPIASQAFMPLSNTSFVVIVARPDADPNPNNMRAFVTNGRQGVNYRRGTWHHPLIALREVSDFLVVDRGNAGGNYDEVRLDNTEIYLQVLPDS